MFVLQGLAVQGPDWDRQKLLHLPSGPPHHVPVHPQREYTLRERDFFIANPLVRIHLIIEMTSVDRPCVIISTFLVEGLEFRV
jgi:hypothetical protein